MLKPFDLSELTCLWLCAVIRAESAYQTGEDSGTCLEHKINDSIIPFLWVRIHQYIDIIIYKIFLKHNFSLSSKLVFIIFAVIHYFVLIRMIKLCYISLNAFYQLGSRFFRFYAGKSRGHLSLSSLAQCLINYIKIYN